MDILLTENQLAVLKLYLSESELDELLMLKADEDRIRAYGMEVVDEFQAGPYEASLVKSSYGNHFQVGLTTTGHLFSGSGDQASKRTEQSQRIIIESLKLIMSKVKDWYNQFGMDNIMIGSFNNSKTHQYHKIFKKFGWNVSHVEEALGGGRFYASLEH